MKRLLIFTLSFLFTCSMYCQKFVPGTIKTMDGTQINGYIKNIGPLEKSNRVIFKDSLNGKPTTYHPEDISGYLVNGNLTYRTTPVQLSGETIKRNLFVRLIVDGQFLNLYRLDYQIREESALFLHYVNTFFLSLAPEKNN